MSTRELDAALYESISSLLNEQRRATPTDRRDSERHAYRCVQLVSPFDGESMPEQLSFHHVMCHDLSPSGFSFYSTGIPETAQLIVALGKVPCIKFFVAEVVRVYPTTNRLGNEYRIGCRFVRRLVSE